MLICTCLIDFLRPPPETQVWGGKGGQMPPPPMPTQVGKIGVCPPPSNIGENFDKKGNFSRRLRRREKNFPKIPLFSEILPANNFAHLRLCPPPFGGSVSLALPYTVQKSISLILGWITLIR